MSYSTGMYQILVSFDKDYRYENEKEPFVAAMQEYDPGVVEGHQFLTFGEVRGESPEQAFAKAATIFRKWERGEEVARSEWTRIRC